MQNQSLQKTHSLFSKIEFMKNTQRLIWGIIFFGVIVFGAVKIAQRVRAPRQQTAQKTAPQILPPAPTVRAAKPQAKIVVADRPGKHKEKAKNEAKENPAEERLSEIQKELAEAGKRNRESYDQPDEAAEYYRLKRLPAGAKEIPIEKYFIAKAQMDAMPQYSTALGHTLPARNEMKKEDKSEFAQTEALGTWTSLGPGSIGGRTRALILHPTNPNIMYAGGVAGGVWKTTNGGGVWQPLTDLLGNLAVSCLAFDPNNPNVIYAGTGEGFYNSNAIRGAGIMKSTDAGATWQQMTSTSTSDFYYVNDLVISKTNTQHLYAATRTGVMRSLDGGATWVSVLNYLDGCLDLAIRTDQATDYIFAACGTFGGAEIFRNIDAGGAGVWTSVQKETGMGRTSLAIAPSNQNIVYALSANTLSGSFRDGLYAVFRSVNSGDAGTWTAQVRNNNPLKLNTVLLTNPLISFRSECGLGANGFSNQGWYDNVIAIDPLDANRVWVGGIDLFRSDDGGLNWGIASYWWPEKNVPQYAHADQHAIVFHPNYNGTTNKQMFVGNDGGIFRTDDARAFVIAGVTSPCNPAASGVRWTSLNNNYGVTQFYHGAVFPDGKSYFGGTQDNGTLLGSDISGQNGWREIYGGDGGYGAIDPTNPNVLYASTQRGAFRKSTDGGMTFGNARLGISDTTLFIAPLAMDPSDPQRLWTGGAKLWRSDNGGANWYDSSLASSPTISAITVAPQDSNYLLVGTISGLIRNVTVVNEFASTFDVQPRGGFVSSIAFDPTNRQTVYATYSTFGGNHIWKSSLGGATWQPLDGTGINRLPDVPAHCIVVDPTNPSRIFVGTDVGLFVTSDGGNNWAVENSGFANTPIEWLVVNTVNNSTSLYAFTHGRGVAKINLTGNACNFSISPSKQIFGAAGGTGTISVVGFSTCNWSATSNADWISLPSSNTGTGNGTVSFSVAPTPFLAKRIGTITIANKSVTIEETKLIDLVPPTIQITLPTTFGFYTTNNGSLSLSGVASDNIGIDSIKWNSDRGGSGNATGTGNWKIDSIQLQAGKNVITLIVTDSIGNTTNTIFTVQFIPSNSITTIAGNGTAGDAGDGGQATLVQLNNPVATALDSAGNLYIAERNSNRIRKVSLNAITATFAQSFHPSGLAIDKSGNVYAAEDGNNQVIKITPDGVSTIFATGLRVPNDVAVDSLNNIFIADSFNRRVVKVTAAGTLTVVAGNGSFGDSGDGGAAIAAQLSYPNGVALDQAGNLYIADLLAGRIRKVDINSGIISTVAGNGTAGFSGDGGLAINAQFNAPFKVAVDQNGNLFIADSQNHRIRKVGADGKISTYAGNGVFGYGGDGGAATSSLLNYPIGVTTDSKGNLYIADSRNHRIRKVTEGVAPDTLSPTLTINAPTNTSSYTTTSALLNLAGSASDNIGIAQIRWKNDRGGDGEVSGTSTWLVSNILLKAGLNNISVTAWDAVGNSFVNTLAVTYSPTNTLSIFAGTLMPGFNLESGTGLASQLYAPETVAFDSSGNLYIADKGNHRIRKVTRSGLISTVAGSGQLGSSGDGGLSINAAMNQPNGVAVDGSGNIYLSDTNNHRIRKVNSAGVITTIAGNGINGFSGDGGQGTQAELDTPVGVTLDDAGNLLIADANNHRIRKLNLSTGVITTIAGNGYGFGGDGGQATQAQLNYPTSVALDKNGNLYISDTSNNQVRKVTAVGIISRFAGTGFRGFSGDGGQATLAQFSAPGGLTVDAAGNLYVTDQGNHRVRKIALDGTMSTVAGNGSTSSTTTDEGGTALNATLNAPAGVAVDAAGNLFIADTNNHRVVVVAAYRATVSVSGASYLPNQPVAVESVVSAFGGNLATRDQAATQLPLLTEMAGTSVKVRDSRGVERLAPLFYVGKSQVNYQISTGTATGFATIIITNGNGEIWTGAVNVVDVQPGVFSATSDGSGFAAASLLFIKNGQRTNGVVANCGAQGCTANSIDVNAYDEVYMELFGTGIRKNSGLTNVSATIGGVSVPVLYAGAHCCYFGVDQVNLPIPKSLAGRGAVEVVLTVDGKVANRVAINVK